MLAGEGLRLARDQVEVGGAEK